MTNNSGTLYTGVTNDIARRVLEHRQGLNAGFTQRYQLTRLVYCESTPDVTAAIEREKQLKGWTRKRKLEQIREQNPHWHDLSAEWLDAEAKLKPQSAEHQILRSAQNDKTTAYATELAPLRPESRGRQSLRKQACLT
jgi:putative endonuclease